MDRNAILVHQMPQYHRSVSSRYAGVSIDNHLNLPEPIKFLSFNIYIVL